MWESRSLRFPSLVGNRRLVFHHAPFPQLYSAAVFTRQLRGRISVRDYGEEDGQHRAHRSRVAQKFAPVLDRAIRRKQCAGSLVPPHHNLKQRRTMAALASLSLRRLRRIRRTAKMRVLVEVQCDVGMAASANSTADNRTFRGRSLRREWQREQAGPHQQNVPECTEDNHPPVSSILTDRIAT